MTSAARAPLADLVAITTRAPLAPPSALLAAEPAARDAAVWEPGDPAQWSMACAGVAAEIRGAGPTRFAEIAAAAPSVWSRVVQVGDAGAPPPRFVGGLAFAPGAARGPWWSGFGDARFVLPRLTYWRRGDEAYLTAIDCDPAPALAALAAPQVDAAPGVVAVREADPDVWRRHIAEIVAAIADGTCAKIVAARTCTVELADAIDPASVLRRLGERHPECTRFAIRAAGRVFVGASPETLVALQGRQVVSEALAGSIARRGDDAGEIARLCASDKDRGEHDLVVQEIARALAPLCERLEPTTTPAIRTLRHIHHLHTPVRATLGAPKHVVEVAAALHPTPAVAGTPTSTALAWIAAREPEPRGWYGAPVGWFDGNGDGHLVVGIRSGVVDGARALLHVGAGIVRESDAEAELDETRVKLRALLGALGAV